MDANGPRELTAVGAGWRYFRRHGLRAALGGLVNRYVYRSYECLVLRCDLAGPPADDHVGDVVFRLATPADLDHLAEFERYGRGSTQRAYVEEDGDWLFVACHGDRIVATRRYSRAVPPYTLMSRVVQLRRGQVWGADIFSLPEYRNRHIARHLAIFGERWLASRGYTELFTSVAGGNTASLRMSYHKGSRPFYHVAYFRLLFYERLLVSKDIPRQFET